MSKKIRIGGVALALMLLASLLVGAIPTSAASLGWSVVTTPGTLGEVLQGDSDVDVIAIAPDGNTIFAFNNAGIAADGNRYLYKSTNAGKTWTTVGIGDTLEAAGANVVAMAVSPNYASDSTLVAATAAQVYRSINGGKSFGIVDATALLPGTNDVITSIDIGPHYLGGDAILVGTKDTDATDFGGVFRYTTSGLAWTDLQVGNGAAAADAGIYDVLAVKLSPNHQADAQYIALVTDEVDTLLTTKFDISIWASGILNATIAGHAPTSGVIAFPGDYEWSSNNNILIGTAGGAKDDVYRVAGALPGGSSRAFDLECSGTGTETEVHSISVKGAIAEAKVMIGQKASTAVRRSSNVLDSAPSWKASTKGPTGAANIQVLYSPAGTEAFVSSTGNGSAFSRSTDDGATWNQLSLIDVSDTANNAAGECALTIADIAVLDANTIYMILADAGDPESLFKTADGGKSWERIWYQADMAIIAPSPAYATDNTVFIAQGDTRIWKTTNAGQTFIGLTAPANVTAIGVVDKSTYYTGHANAFYKSGRWTAATIFGGNATSILVTPKSEILVGTDAGDIAVSTDDGKNFNRVGAQAVLGAGNVILAIGPDYATKPYIYAGSAVLASGLQRYDMAGAAPWKPMDLDSVTAGTQADSISGVVVTADNSLYAASPTANAAVYRSVGPSSPLDKLGFQQIHTDYPNADTGIIGGLNVVSGSNVVYAVADIDLNNAAADDLTGTYGYEYRIITFGDTVTSEVSLSAPKNNTITAPSGQVTFSWGKVAADVDLTYTLQAATDVDFANKVDLDPGTAGINDLATTGTSITPSVTFQGGTTYWWRVRITAAGGVAISSKYSAKWTFSPQIAKPVLRSPDAGEMYAALMPTFSWDAVAGAESYTLEMADNPFYANSQVKKPLTHNVWTWDEELEIGKTYYWRVQALKGANVSAWTETVFTVNTDPNITAAEQIIAAQQPPVVVPPTPPAPVPNIILPQPIVNLPATPAPTQVSPPFIWAIIIIGAILVIAVIVLIVRTRRVS